MKRLPPLSEMERIEQTLLVEKLDEILERIDNEDIGFVITGSGLPDMVLIPFRWFAENFPDEVPDGLRRADFKSRQILPLRSREKMDEKFNRIPVSVIHLDKDGTVIDVKDYNLDKVEPDLWAIKGLAASLLPVIREFYTHEENVQAFEAWLKERENNSQKHSKRK